jgi:hypothetical protein
MAVEPFVRRGLAQRDESTGRLRSRPETTRVWNDAGRGLEHADFSVVVKNRALMPKPWRWEIYRAGRKSPIQCSLVFFETMTEANRSGKKALERFLTDFHL